MVEAGGTIYSSECGKFVSPTALTSGGIDALHLLPSSSVTPTVASKPTPTLPTAGVTPGNTTLRFLLGLASTSVGSNLYLSADANHNLIADPGGASNSVDWSYGSDGSLSLKLSDGSTVYLSDLPASQGPRGDAKVLSGPLVGTTAATWSIPQIAYDQETWPYPDYSSGQSQTNKHFGSTSTFLYHPGTQQYLVFNWNDATKTPKPMIAIYPSPESFANIDGSVNWSYVNYPPTSIGSGLYYLQGADSGQCLEQDLSFGACSWEQSAWNYNQQAGTIAHTKGGDCLRSTLDAQCAGSGELAVAPCGQGDQFVLGTNGEMFLTRCSVCYGPEGALKASRPGSCGSTWRFQTTSGPGPSGRSRAWLWILLAALIFGGLGVV